MVIVMQMSIRSSDLTKHGSHKTYRSHILELVNVVMNTNYKYMEEARRSKTVGQLEVDTLRLWRMVNMNVLAYLVTLGNIQSMQSSGPIRNLSVKLGDLHSLQGDLQELPDFNVEKFRETGYYRVGDTGMYLSKNLRDFMYDGIGQPNDEGLILTINFNKGVNAVKSDDSTLSLLLHREPVDDDVKEQLGDYLDNRHARRQRSLVDMLRT